MSDRRTSSRGRVLGAIRATPTADLVLGTVAVALAGVAWVGAAVDDWAIHPVLAAACYSVVAAAVPVRRTYLMPSFAATYGALAVMCASGSATALGVFPLILAVPLTIEAVTMYAPRRWPGRVAVAVACLGSPLSPAVAASWSATFSIALHVTVLLAVYLWASRRRIAREAAEAARDREVEFATLAERQRIAADLHDGIGHALTAIHAKASTAEATAAARPERAVDALRVISEVSKKSLNELRATIGGIGADADPLAGAGVADLAAGLAALDVEIAWDLPSGIGDLAALDRRLSSRSRDVVHRVLREAFTNVVRHNDPGTAVDVVVRVERPHSRREMVTFTVSNPRAPTGSSHAGSGTGRAIMAARVADVGGRLSSRADGERWTVEFTVPTRSGASR